MRITGRSVRVREKGVTALGGGGGNVGIGVHQCGCEGDSVGVRGCVGRMR